MLCIKLPLFPLLTWDLTYLQRCNTLDRNLILYSFSRLIAIVVNTNSHIYAREEQILTIRMIVLEEWVYNVHKNLKMKIMNNTFHAWWHEQQFFGDFIVIS